MKNICGVGITADILSDWRSHLLSPAEQERLDTHVGGCAACQSIIAQHERIAQALRVLPARPTGATVWNLLWMRIRTTRGKHMTQQRQRLALSGLATALTIVTLFALFFVFLNHHGIGGRTSLSPSPVATLVATPAPTSPSPTSQSSPTSGSQTFNAIAMFSTTTGWGLATTSTHDLMPEHTSDGGHTWTNVTPRDPVPACCKLYARTATDAWLTPWVGSSPSPTRFWHTIDEGRTWTQLTVNTSGVLSLFFLDATHGWIVSSPSGTTAGQQVVTVWQTVNGGTTWTQLTPTGIGGKYSTGITFINATTGYLSGSLTADSLVGTSAPLLITHNGGATWTDTTLTIPTALQASYDESQADPPNFWSATNGIVFDTLSNQTGFTFLSFRTADGGTTWTAGPNITSNDVGLAATNSPVVWSVAPDGNAIAAVTKGNGDIVLYSLAAGANSWLIISSSAPTTSLLHGLTSIDMINKTTGWALSSAGLLMTTDGGITWVLLH